MEKTALTRETLLSVLREQADEIRERFKVRSLGLFGSFANDEARVDSDIDMLVEFEQPSFDNYMDLKFFLEDLLGRTVDLVMKDTLKPRIKQRILKEVKNVQGL